MNSLLHNKIIFITGAGGVLGKAYIEEMINNGAFVIASDLPGQRANLLKERFSLNSNFKYYDLDVSNEKEVDVIFNRIQADGLRPNVVINNAAITGELLMGAGKSFPDFANTSLNDWEKTLRVNLTGSFLIARQMDRDIVGKYSAQLINIASMYAFKAPHHDIYEDMPFKSFSAYSSSKAGIHGLTLWLSSYWSKRECNVNTLAPGAIFNGHSKKFQKRVSDLIINGRMADPKEIADVMIFLCSDNSRYMNGQIINVDGGFNAW